MYPQTSSANEAEEGFTLQYGGRRHLRVFAYDDVPAAHVKQGRGSDTAYASFGSLSAGDTNNTVYDLWEHAHTGEEVLVVHDAGDAVNFVEPDQNKFEGYRIDSAEQRMSFDAWYQTEQRAGEIYNLQWDVVITAGDRRAATTDETYSLSGTASGTSSQTSSFTIPASTTMTMKGLGEVDTSDLSEV